MRVGIESLYAAVAVLVKRPFKGRELFEFGAGNETRTRDPDLGKTGRYQVNQVDRPSNRASRANEIKWLPLPTCQLLANAGALGKKSPGLLAKMIPLR